MKSERLNRIELNQLCLNRAAVQCAHTPQPHFARSIKPILSLCDSSCSVAPQQPQCVNRFDCASTRITVATRTHSASALPHHDAHSTATAADARRQQHCVRTTRYSSRIITRSMRIRRLHRDSTHVMPHVYHTRTGASLPILHSGLFQIALETTQSTTQRAQSTTELRTTTISLHWSVAPRVRHTEAQCAAAHPTTGIRRHRGARD